MRNGHVTGLAHTVDLLTNNIQNGYMHLRPVVMVSDKIRKGISYSYMAVA